MMHYVNMNVRRIIAKDLKIPWSRDSQEPRFNQLNNSNRLSLLKIFTQAQHDVLANTYPHDYIGRMNMRMVYFRRQCCRWAST